jgi:ATP-dependent DNA helicase RecG
LSNPHSAISELSQIVAISSTAIENNIKKLKKKGLIERVGADKGGYWRVIKK